jgi:hypothetical protein
MALAIARRFNARAATMDLMSPRSTYTTGNIAKLAAPARRRNRATGYGTSAVMQTTPGAVVLVAAASALIGMIVGNSVATPTQKHMAHRQGACAALDIAQAYGLVDDNNRRLVVRGLTQANNPYASLFPGGYRALSDACADVARHRWADR